MPFLRFYERRTESGRRLPEKTERKRPDIFASAAENRLQSRPYRTGCVFTRRRRRSSLLDFRSGRTSLTPAAVNGLNLIRVDFGYRIPFHFQSRCQLNADAERMLQQNKSADTLEAPESF